MYTLHLGVVGSEPFTIDAEKFVTGRTCILGASGSGKSYLVGVVCEELCENNLPFTLVDLEGEYSGLKEKYNLVWVGEDKRCDLQWCELNIEELAKEAPDCPPLLLDVSQTDEPLRKVEAFVTRLYKEVTARRTPYLIIQEEADRVAPQIGDKLRIFKEVAMRGRKRGLGLMLCTQRPSSVDKDILSQCSNQLIGRLVIRNDLQTVSQFFSGRGLPKQLTALTSGEFYVLGGLSVFPVCVKIRARKTHHGGITPSLTSRMVRPFLGTVAKQHAEKKGKEYLGVRPGITASMVTSLVKKSKRFFLFGEEETIAEVRMVLRPILEIGVRVKKGVIKKRFETLFLLLDGVTGQSLELDDKFTHKKGLERLLGLSSQELLVFRSIKPDKDSIVVEIAARANVSKGVARNLIKTLEDRRLVRSLRVGRKTTYRRLVDMPSLRLRKTAIQLEKVHTTEATVTETNLKEEEIREVVKGLMEASDVESFRVFYYPLYYVNLTLRDRHRVVWIDGISTKSIKL